MNSNHLAVFWPHNRVQFNGRSISEAWAEEMTAYGVDILDKPDGADLAFFISDSVLDEAVAQKMPSICYFWGFPPARMFDGGWRDQTQYAMRRLAYVTRVLVPGPVTQDQLSGYAIESQICIPGVDTKTLDASELRIPKENEVVFLSRLAPEKRLEYLIQALSLIGGDRPTLVVMGPGDQRPYIQLCRDLHVEARFTTPTDIEKVNQIKRALVLVHPSEYEGFGLPPLEALYLRTPAVVWGTPQMRWLLQEQGVYAESVEGLAQAIADVLGQREGAQRMADDAHDRIAKSLTLKEAAKRLWPHLHQAAKEWWGMKVHADPTNKALIQDAYEAEARRNWAYSFGPAEWNGPARFDPTWSRHFRAKFFIDELRAGGAVKIADVGSGPVYPTIFSMAGFQVTAVDVAQANLDHALVIARKWNAEGAISTQQGFAQQLPFGAESFDAVIEGEIWEHVPDPRELVSEAMRVLRPGGLLIASCPIGSHHLDPMHLPEGGGFSEQLLHDTLLPWESQIVKIERIAEDGTEPSCFLVVLKKELNHGGRPELDARGKSNPS